MKIEGIQTTLEKAIPPGYIENFIPQSIRLSRSKFEVKEKVKEIKMSVVKQI